MTRRSLTFDLSLSVGQTYGPQPIFSITIPGATSVGLYSATFNLLGGPGVIDGNLLSTTTFQVNVVAPEPITGLAVLLGLVATAAVRHRKSRRRDLVV